MESDHAVPGRVLFDIMSHGAFPLRAKLWQSLAPVCTPFPRLVETRCAVVATVDKGGLLYCYVCYERILRCEDYRGSRVGSQNGMWKAPTRAGEDRKDLALYGDRSGQVSIYVHAMLID